MFRILLEVLPTIPPHSVFPTVPHIICWVSPLYPSGRSDMWRHLCMTPVCLFCRQITQETTPTFSKFSPSRSVTANTTSYLTMLPTVTPSNYISTHRQVPYELKLPGPEEFVNLQSVLVQISKWFGISSAQFSYLVIGLSGKFVQFSSGNGGQVPPSSPFSRFIQFRWWTLPALEATVCRLTLPRTGPGMRVAVLRILVLLAARWAVGWATFYFLSQILGDAGFPMLSIMLNSMVLIKINFDLV